MLGLLALPIAIATSVVVAAVAVASFGLVIAPLNTLRTQLLAEAVAAPNRGEAFAILWGAIGIGTGLGGVAVGLLLGVVGASGAIVVAGVAAIVGGLTGPAGALQRVRLEQREAPDR
jgi:hypothetical protein